MSHSKEVVPRGSAWSPEFVKELLPSAERVALLYHLSYLCLAGFPKLETLLRSRALETQLLFGSSEVLLFKCIATSENLVNSLFPILKTAVKKNKPTLALKYLGKAKIWITNIIDEVDRIVEKYNLHNKDVATTTSDVISEKIETDSKIKAQTNEVKSTEEALKMYKDNLKQVTAKLEALDKEINEKKYQIEQLVQDIARRNRRFSIFGILMPFVGHLIASIIKASKDPMDKAKIQDLQNKIKSLTSEKNELQQKEWTIQNDVIIWQMKAAKLRIDLGSIPSPEHLNEVQTSLSRIQQILIQLQKFWERIGVMLDYLKDKTFVGEDMIEELDTLKGEFLNSITAAEEVWKRFGAICAEANGIFRAQAKDAYRFLEVSPSSLSKVEWQKRYDAVKEKLEKIYPSPSIEGSDIENSAAEAITH